MYFRRVSSRGHRTHKSYVSALIALSLSYPQVCIYCAVMSFRKTLNSNIATSDSAIQWIRAQDGNRKIVDCQFGS